MKKKICAILVLLLILSSILVGNNTVLLNETENKYNKIDKKTMFISKSYLLGLSTECTIKQNEVASSSNKNVLINQKPKPTSTPKVESKSKVVAKTKQTKNIKSELKLNGKKKQVNNKKVNKKVTQKKVKNKPKKVAKKKTTTKKTKKYSQQDLYILSHIIYAEAGGQSWDFQVAVGSVVLNRVKSKKFPNTIRGVVFQKGQYASTWDGNYNKTPSKQSIKVAKYLLKNGSQLPKYVYFQAEFLQSDRVYKKMGNTYFCYNSKDVR